MFSTLILSVTIAAAMPANRAAMATKLAEALANTRTYTATKVYVGELPPNVSIAAPLPKFTLLGSVVSTPFNAAENSGRSAEIYYQLPSGTSDSTLQAYRKQLEAAGWKSSRFMQRFMQAESSSGGFAVSRPQPQLPDLYCGTRGFLAFLRLRSMPDVIAISFGAGQEFTAICTMSAMLSAMPSPPPPPPLPTLQPPQNVTMEASGRFSAQVLSTESNASITTAEPLPRVGAAFAQQLTAVGWAADDAAQSATAYAQTFHMTSKGRHLYAVLNLVSTGKDRKFDASLRVADLDQRPAAPGFSFPFFP